MKVSKSMLQRSREFDLVIFGASGFTGKHVVDYLCNKSDLNKYKVALAGRDIERIKKVTKDHSNKNIPIIEADVFNPESMKKLTSRTSILLNCVGPYQILGESVVKSCIDTRTHHLDVSGEPYYLESVQVKYHHEAVAKDTLIVGACGFDSVPTDLGIDLVIKKFGSNNIDWIDTYLQTKSSGGRIRGNHPTWVSLVTGYSNRGQLKDLRSKIFDPKFYYDGRSADMDIARVMNEIKSQSMSKRQSFHYKYQNYNLPFPGSDRSVVKRTQLLNLITNPNYRMVPVETYYGFPSVINLLGVAFGAISIKLLKNSSKGRNVLINHANIFSLGLFDKNVNPSKEQLDKYSFDLMIVANMKNPRTSMVDNGQEVKGDHGQTVKEQKTGEQKSGQKKMDEQKKNFVEPGQELQKKLFITGPDPGYKTAAICIIECAMSILNEKKIIPVTGGVITPGYAFSVICIANPCRNGDCIAPDTCDCFDGWTGDRCDSPIIGVLWKVQIKSSNHSAS